MSDIKTLIRQLAQPDGETVALVCTVDAVNEKARTIDCSPLNEGAPLLGVNLQANQGADFGLCLFPEVGSYVVVGFVADGAAGVVLATDKITAAEIVIGDNSAIIDADGCRFKTANMSVDFNAADIIFNGGTLNGLVIIQKLTEKLNGLKDTVNSLINLYNAHTHVTTATVDASGVPGVLSPTASIATPAVPFVASDYENTKIKH